jgi:hypothetical protein
MKDTVELIVEGHEVYLSGVAQGQPFRVYLNDAQVFRLAERFNRTAAQRMERIYQVTGPVTC